MGYGDPSYFSREYKRHFGEPPIRDIERLRTTAWGPAAGRIGRMVAYRSPRELPFIFF